MHAQTCSAATECRSRMLHCGMRQVSLTQRPSASAAYRPGGMCSTADSHCAKESHGILFVSQIADPRGVTSIPWHRSACHSNVQCPLMFVWCRGCLPRTQSSRFQADCWTLQFCRPCVLSAGQHSHPCNTWQKRHSFSPKPGGQQGSRAARRTAVSCGRHRQEPRRRQKPLSGRVHHRVPRRQASCRWGKWLRSADMSQQAGAHVQIFSS